MSDINPEMIGKYRVIREIGRGATSHVYLAEDAFHERRVAIKVVKSAGDADDDLQRRYQRVFMNEAALAGRLNHPHIAAIYDAATDDTMSYIVMELVDGGTLEQYCDPATLLPLERVVEILFKASVALDYAHRQGVIHCDIKPANILISGTSDIKVSDFGASYFGQAQHTFLTGVGSPAYMSPEQVQERQVNHQTDIYSLGVVMYQLLTGRLPFQGSSRASLLYQVVNIEPPPPSQFRHGISGELDSIVMRALAKSRDDRYPHWIDFSRDLAQAFQNVSLPEDPVSDMEKFTAVRKLGLFQDFRDVDLWEMLRVARWSRIETGQFILREGESAAGFFVLTRGIVEVSRQGRILDTLEAGHCFGDILYFESPSGLRTTTIRTAAPCLAMEVPFEALRLASDALQMQFSRAFMRILVDRLEKRELRIVSGPGEDPDHNRA